MVENNELEVRVKRLEEVVAKLATELERRWYYLHAHSSTETHHPRGMIMPDPNPSTEEMVEMTLYPEHFEKWDEFWCGNGEPHNRHGDCSGR